MLKTKTCWNSVCCRPWMDYKRIANEIKRKCGQPSAVMQPLEPHPIPSRSLHTIHDTISPSHRSFTSFAFCFNRGHTSNWANKALRVGPVFPAFGYQNFAAQIDTCARVKYEIGKIRLQAYTPDLPPVQTRLQFFLRFPLQRATHTKPAY